MTNARITFLRDGNTAITTFYNLLRNVHGSGFEEERGHIPRRVVVVTAARQNGEI